MHRFPNKMLVCTSYKGFDLLGRGPQGQSKALSWGTGPLPSRSLLLLGSPPSASREVGSLRVPGGPTVLLAVSPAASWVKRHTGILRWMGEGGLGGQGRDAGLATSRFKKPQRVRERWASTVPHFITVAAQMGKLRPRGAGTYPRSRSQPGRGGPVPRAPPGARSLRPRARGWRGGKVGPAQEPVCG